MGRLEQGWSVSPCQLRCSNSMLSSGAGMPRAAGLAPQAEGGAFPPRPPSPSYQPLQAQGHKGSLAGCEASDVVPKGGMEKSKSRLGRKKRQRCQGPGEFSSPPRASALGEPQQWGGGWPWQEQLCHTRIASPGTPSDAAAVPAQDHQCLPQWCRSSASLHPGFPPSLCCQLASTIFPAVLASLPMLQAATVSLFHPISPEFPSQSCPGFPPAAPSLLDLAGSPSPSWSRVER